MRDLLGVIAIVLLALTIPFFPIWGLLAIDCHYKFAGTGIPSRMSGVACQAQVDGVWWPAEMVFRVEK